MLSLFTTLEIIFSIALIFIVLVQKKNVSLNLSTMGGGMGVVSKRGPEKVLQNITIVLAIGFIVNSLVLFIIS